MPAWMPAWTLPLLAGLFGVAPATALAEDPTAPPPPELLERARDAVTCARARDELAPDKDRLVTLIDFSKSSVDTRFWVVDLESGEVLHAQRVSHGQGTGDDLATAFSNRPGSHQSSLGVFRTAETYVGKHGYSLRLDGLEAGVNDRARQRAIVVHGADYNSDAFIEEVGRLGRSWGCPALPTSVSQEVINTIKDGTLMLAWYPDDEWVEESEYLSCDALANDG